MSPPNCNETLSPYQDGDDDCSTEIVNENHPIDARWPCQEWAIAEIVSLPIFLTVDFNGAESSIEPDHRPLPFVLGVGIQIAFLSACRARTKKPGCGKAPSAGLGSSDTSVGRDWCLVLGTAEANLQARRMSRPRSGQLCISKLSSSTSALNLADTDQRSYLRVGIDLELHPEAKHGEKLAPVAQVRDTILSVLADAHEL
jgi:hypothetical protein